MIQFPDSANKKKGLESVIEIMFNSIDINLDGSIVVEEFTKYFLSLGIVDTSFAAKVFNYMDTNKDGSVNKKGLKNFYYSTQF